MEPYMCSVCGARVPRDLILYVSHTDQHIIDEIRKNHPDWIEKDGICVKCVDYYKKALGKVSR